MSEEMQQSPAPEAPKVDVAPAPVAAPVQAEVSAPVADPADVEQNKVMAIVGYIIPILFFVPMLSEKKSPFGMFHANQQLVLLISCVVAYLASSVLMVVLIGFLLMPIVWIASVVLMIMGIVHAAKGEMKPLPIIGGFSILK